MKLSWNQRHPDRMCEYQRRYRRRNRIACLVRVRRWRRLHPEATRAHAAVGRALASGLLKRPSRCSSCTTKGPVDAHHADYSKPLKVLWLCHQCNCKADAQRRRTGSRAPYAPGLAKRWARLRGELNGAAKLTTTKVRAIRRALARGESVAKLANDFRISQSQLWNIKSGRHWKGVV